METTGAQSQSEGTQEAVEPGEQAAGLRRGVAQLVPGNPE